MKLNIHKVSMLQSYIEDISDDCFCATWLSGIEYELWSIIQGDTPAINLYSTIYQSELDDMKLLSTEINGWVTWGDDDIQPMYISLDEWLITYNKWKERSGVK